MACTSFTSCAVIDRLNQPFSYAYRTREDVITDEAGGVRFASELVRRRVSEYQKKE